MIHQLLDQVKDPKERAVFISAVMEQRKALQYSAIKAMASLCNGPLAPALHSSVDFNVDILLNWIKSILEAKQKDLYRIAEISLDYVLSSNASNSEIWESILRSCYSEGADSPVAVGFFKVLCDYFCSGRPHPCTSTKLRVLALFKISHPKLIVRQYAANLVFHLDKYEDLAKKMDEVEIPDFMDDFEVSKESYEDKTTKKIPPSRTSLDITSAIPAVYQKAQLKVSVNWAFLWKRDTFDVFFHSGL
jgi:hypothetical protein